MFLTGSNFSSILLSVSLYGIMTAGAIYCCLTSGPDLSVGGMAALSSVISVRIIIANHYTVQGVVLGFLAAIAVSAVIGLIHGLIIYYFKAQSSSSPWQPNTLCSGWRRS